MSQEVSIRCSTGHHLKLDQITPFQGDLIESIYENIYVSKSGYLENRKKHHSVNKIPTRYLDKDGYERVWINRKGKQKFIPVHRIVALTFLNQENSEHVVNHKDGIRTNNNVSNLEWILPADNERHARKVLGKKLLGEKASRSKLKTKQVIKICKLKLKDISDKKIMKKFNISKSQVIRIINGKNWGHLWKTENKSLLNAKDIPVWNWMRSRFSREI